MHLNLWNSTLHVYSIYDTTERNNDEEDINTTSICYIDFCYNNPIDIHHLTMYFKFLLCFGFFTNVHVICMYSRSCIYFFFFCLKIISKNKHLLQRFKALIFNMFASQSKSTAHSQLIHFYITCSHYLDTLHD